MRRSEDHEVLLIVRAWMEADGLRVRIITSRPGNQPATITYRAGIHELRAFLDDWLWRLDTESGNSRRNWS